MENSTLVGPEESAVETLHNAVGKLAAKVVGLFAKMETLSREYAWMLRRQQKCLPEIC
jgi:hypothetical protein